MTRIVPVSIALILAASIAGAASEKSTRKDLPWLGMGVSRHADHNAQHFLHVERVAESGPAARAGIRPGDIITAVAGSSIQHMDDLDFLTLISEQKPGDRMAFTITREGRSVKISVLVGVMPDSARESWARALANARRARIAAQRRNQ